MNNALLDTYQLKSLDAVLEAPVEEMILNRTADNRLHLDVRDRSDSGEGEDSEAQAHEGFDNFAMRDDYDRVISCLGFKFDDSIFAK